MEQYNHRSGITLMELLIAIVLLSVVVLAVSSIDLFSRYHVITSDRRARLQNELSYTLEHMTKEISKAVGNRQVQNPINITTIQGYPGIAIYTDSDRNGQADLWIAYIFYNVTPYYEIRYCSNCSDGWCSTCNILPLTTIARRIQTFTPADNNLTNYIDVNITGRWQPALDVSVDNPEITMRTRIKMPSVTIH